MSNKTQHSRVVMNRADFNNPLLKECERVAELGGSFRIKSVWEEQGWYNHYWITYPDSAEVDPQGNQ